MHLNLARKLYLGDTPKIFPQNLFLDFELMLVRSVLVMASPAPAEMRTRRSDAMR
jgi:hypothetical protein